MDKTHAMGFTLPFIRTTAIMKQRKGRLSTTCLVSDKAPAVHLFHQVMRPLHVPWEQFSCLLRW